MRVLHWIAVVGLWLGAVFVIVPALVFAYLTFKHGYGTPVGGEYAQDAALAGLTGCAFGWAAIWWKDRFL